LSKKSHGAKIPSGFQKIRLSVFRWNIERFKSADLLNPQVGGGIERKKSGNYHTERRLHWGFKRVIRSWMKYESKNREQPIRLRKVSICRNHERSK